MPWRPSRVHLAARRGALDLPLASIRFGADRFPWVVSRGAAMDVIYLWVMFIAIPLGKFVAYFTKSGGKIVGSARCFLTDRAVHVGYKQPKETIAMQLDPKEPCKEQEPAPEPIDPPSDAPPVELPSDPLDKPNV